MPCLQGNASKRYQKIFRVSTRRRDSQWQNGEQTAFSVKLLLRSVWRFEHFKVCDHGRHQTQQSGGPEPLHVFIYTPDWDTTTKPLLYKPRDDKQMPNYGKKHIKQKKKHRLQRDRATTDRHEWFRNNNMKMQLRPQNNYCKSHKKLQSDPKWLQRHKITTKKLTRRDLQ